MFLGILGVLLLLVSVAVGFFIKTEANSIERKIKSVGISIASVLSAVMLLGGAFQYNDGGNCQHVRTVFGSEKAVCTTGWYFEGFGYSNQYPWAITVSNTSNPQADGSSVSAPHKVRMADNWTGHIKQVTRFEIPQEEEAFLEMARMYRSPERLVSALLKPAVVASMDSVANMYTMEEYYAGGERDNFKTDFRDTIAQGRAVVEQVKKRINTGVVSSDATANNSEGAENTSSVGDTSQEVIVMQKVLGKNGMPIREQHDFMQFGIKVGSAILEDLDPDDKFEQQIQARKDAASRRIVAREERKEQEEQRLLAIQAGKTEIAKRQAKAEVEQIEKTTNAETSKQLALIEAERQREEAQIAKQTSEINLDKARIDAQAVQVAADAQAYEKRVILEADGALAQKLEALVAINKEWASAASQINVPQTVFAGGGDSTAGNALGTVDNFMQLMTAKAAKDLQIDASIQK